MKVGTASSCILLALLLTPALHAQSVDDLFDDESKKSNESVESERQKTLAPLRPTGERAQMRFADTTGRAYTLDTMAAVDMVGAWDKNQPRTTTNQAMVRSGEVGFYSSIDHLADGVLLLAADNEGGTLSTGVEEAYLQMNGTLLPNTVVRLGKMHLDSGRLNSIHRHDWSFVTAPLVHSRLLGEEALANTGAEIRVLMPWSFWQELTIGVYNGHGYGAAIDNGSPRSNPLVNLHLKQFLPISGEWGTQFGLTYLRWHPETDPRKISQQYGIDYLLKYKRGKLASFQWITEAWMRTTNASNAAANERWLSETLASGQPATPADVPVQAEDTKKAGTYTYLEWQPIERWSLGARYDFFYTPSMTTTNTLTGEQVRKRNGIEGGSLVVTWRPSEFSFFRGQASAADDLETGRRTWEYDLQATFIIGKHPAHVY